MTLYLTRRYLAIHQVVKWLEEILEFARGKCYMRYQKGKRKLWFEAFCGMELRVPKKIVKIVKEELQGDIYGTCAACCGYLSVERRDMVDSIYYILWPCSCHPWGDITIVFGLPLEAEEVLKAYGVVLF